MSDRVKCFQSWSTTSENMIKTLFGDQVGGGGGRGGKNGGFRGGRGRGDRGGYRGNNKDSGSKDREFRSSNHRGGSRGGRRGQGMYILYPHYFRPGLICNVLSHSFG